MTNDTTHECPAPDCTERVPFERFCCPTHWYKVRSDHRTDLWREFRRNMAEDSYFKARARCLQDLGVPVHEIAELNGGVGL